VYWPLLVFVPIALFLLALVLVVMLSGLVRWLRLLAIRRDFKQAERWLRDRTRQAAVDMDEAYARHQIINGDVAYSQLGQSRRYGDYKHGAQ